MKIDSTYMTNNGSYSWNDPEYIVIHYTAGQYGVTAENNAIYYYNHGGDVECGTHFFVGDDGIFASTPTWRGAWTNGNYQANTHAINIEVACGSDEDFTQGDIDNLRDLVCYLIDEFDIDYDHIIRHYDVVDYFSGQTVDPHKLCPRPYIDNDRWYELKDYITNRKEEDMATPQEVWGYQNTRLENVDAYQMLRDCRDNTENIAIHMTALTEAVKAMAVASGADPAEIGNIVRDEVQQALNKLVLKAQA